MKTKILKLMNDGKHHSILEISKKLGVSWSTTRNHFLELQLDKKISVDYIGKHKYFIIKK